MTIDETIKRMIQDEVENQVASIKDKIALLKPWLKMREFSEVIGKKSSWIRENLCTDELMKKKLVKKIGGEWHFRNPEIFKYLHDEWWLKNDCLE
ncbi:hypothetical protein [Carnobacterium maltaromaticum]|uniref:hypothetical protein n=1 Tax=Carnobacterium maltaromaticum TaxID=2751 RepID=UPI00191B91E6|nr:hypothetical protein [Carnobacterium maltaromaticum]CAD5900560.1 conserved hypothetical protein [Carnobacterium maltaromaticum]